MRSGEEHLGGRLQALIDGELPPEEERALRGHCRKCGLCGKRLRDAEEIYRRLGELPDADLKGSLWPHVQRSLSERRPGRLRIAFGAPAMAAAGVLIGLLIGPAADSTRSPAAGESTWAEIGSLLDDETLPTLDVVYLGLDTEEETR